MFQWWRTLETTRTAGTVCRCDKRTDLSAACLPEGPWGSRYHPSYTNLEGKPCGLGHMLRWCSVVVPLLRLSVALIIYSIVIPKPCEGGIKCHSHWQWLCRSWATWSYISVTHKTKLSRVERIICKYELGLSLLRPVCYLIGVCYHCSAVCV